MPTNTDTAPGSTRPDAGLPGDIMLESTRSDHIRSDGAQSNDARSDGARSDGTRSDPTRLDVRPVAPKDRFGLIMGTFEDLAGGATMELIVDHDPECMYFTLKATRGDEAFDFEYLERGPIDWRVLVTKR